MNAGGGLDVLGVDLGPGVSAGFSNRSGGSSLGPHTSLNLGYHVGDDWDRAYANRQVLGGWLRAPITMTTQVHGADVAHVDRYRPNMKRKADALLSTTPGVGIGVMVADCVPVLLADARAGVVATAHAGRGGLVGGVVPNVVAAMVAHGARVPSIRAAIGPSICGRCYEVPEQLRTEVETAVPGTAGETSWGTPSIDIAAGVLSQLKAAGVQRISRVDDCTYEDERYFSYRRDGVTGRFAGVVALIGPAPSHA
ncbi:peptidoglycan editing factor PgeF [Pseudactinotalea terrae]|uniref:peptidoglycan editing factor PgeF n=1 Tax=Pseudactinotalea terrae TaxID=1743262 RepID=UPI0019D689F4|nr:peptidoglycan editing factor PgeF [Pseudactinotalea terrae]